MRLLKLTLQNFQGIKDFVLEPNGEDISVFGDNGTGKTTLFNAFSWLLFGKDSLGSSQFEIKRLDSTGEAEHGLEHCVEAVLSHESDHNISIRKVYAEKWTKKRGSATKEFVGHTIDHYIDGVPVKAGEFSAAINQMCPEKLFRLLTNPKHFNDQLKWEERRRVLLEVCGDISDQDVIAADAKLAKLPAILLSHTIDDHRKILSGRRTELNREINELPVRISEVQKGIVEIDIPDLKRHRSQIVLLKEELKEKQTEKARIEAGGEIAEKRKRLAEIDEKLTRLQISEQRKHSEAMIAIGNQRRSIQDQILAIELQINSISSEVQGRSKTITQVEEELIKLRAEWQRVFESKFLVGPCQICGALPENQPLLEEAERNFNLSKSSVLMDISERGKAGKADRDAMLSKNEEAKKRWNSLSGEILILKDQLQAMDTPDQPAPPISPEQIALQEARNAVEKSIASLSETVDTSAVESEIKAIESDIATKETALLQVDQNEKSERRISELKLQERDLAEEYEHTEKELYLIDLFLRRKAEMLEGMVTGKFQLARFKLFNQLINGGVEPCCETTYNGVPFSSLNGAMRINIGLDICQTLSKHHGIMAPIFIDNAESVVDLLPTEAQQIRLVVSGEHKTLTIGE